jgi:hypothetical protein
MCSQKANTLCGSLTRTVRLCDQGKQLYLDSSRTDEELQGLAEIIAASPFSNEELEHILCYQVAPVCSSNLFQCPGGEWALFPPDELIPNCLHHQSAKPFQPGKRRPLLWLLSLVPTPEPYFLLRRVARLRQNARR